MRFILGVLLGYYMRGKKRLLIITLTVFIVLIIMCSVVLPKETVSCSKEMAGHTGQSSQLFPVTTGRNAQFLATVARSGLVRQVEIRPPK